MKPSCFNPISDLLVVVDVQDPFINHIDDGDKVLSRCEFLVRSAKVLGVPILATAQVPERLGSLSGRLTPYIPEVYSKNTFSAWDCPEFQKHFGTLGWTNVILVGVESHICVLLTAKDLMKAGLKVSVCLDAIGSRTKEGYKAATMALTQAGAKIIHTESLVYEWLKSSEHPKFKEVLDLVKLYS